MQCGARSHNVTNRREQKKKKKRFAKKKRFHNSTKHAVWRVMFLPFLSLSRERHVLARFEGEKGPRDRVKVVLLSTYKVHG